MSGQAWAEGSAPQVGGLWQRDTLTGDWGGARSRLAARGVEIGLSYIGETLGTVSGGVHQGWIYEGRLEGAVDLDLETLMGWSGGSVHASAFQIHHAKGLPTADYTASLAAASNIEAVETVRLFTLWLEQSLFDGVLSIRAGQLAADDEFFTSPTAGGLINGTFGWGVTLSANQIQGGPAYPLASPGVRVQLNPSKDIALLGAVFFGDPAGHDCAGDPQICDKHGVRFSAKNEPLWLAELQYAPSQEEGASGLPGLYKIGVWYGDSENNFINQRLGLDGSGATVSLAHASVAAPLTHDTDWGLYGVADQTLWAADRQSASLFLRAGYAPKDRNLVSFYVDGGFGLTGLLPGRPDDTLTFGAAYMKISGDARAVDRELLAAASRAGPVRDHEMVFELSYTALLTPWLSIQPDLQYIVHPGGHVPDADDPTVAIGDAFVGGVRFTLAL